MCEVVIHISTTYWGGGLCDWGIPDTYTDRMKKLVGRHSYEVAVCVMGDAGQV